MSHNSSSIENDPIGARWHGEVDLEVVPIWHAFAYLCTLLGYFEDVPQGNMDSGNSHNDNDGLEGNGAMDIHLGLHVMAYLHACRILVGLTP